MVLPSEELRHLMLDGTKDTKPSRWGRLKSTGSPPDPHPPTCWRLHFHLNIRSPSNSSLLQFQVFFLRDVPRPAGAV